MAKAVLLTETISPYRIPVFNELARNFKAEFLVFFFGESEKRREWKIYKEQINFCYEVLPGILFQRRDLSPYFFNPTIFYRLLRYSPDVIIIGSYHDPSSFLAIVYAKLFRRRVILWCESNKYDYRGNFPLKMLYKRWFIDNCNAYVVPGKASFEYLISLGAFAEKIWVAPNAVDNEYFSHSCDKYKDKKETFKRSKGYPRRLILYVGRLINQKGIFDLLKAFQLVSGELADSGLVLVGSGKDENHYRDFCKTNNLKNVFFAGFMHQEALVQYYAVADVFVLPTHSDPWGLVLNEAMACGLAVVSSDVAGAALDLIRNGENGYIFKKGDIHGLAVYLKNILSDEYKLAEMGRKSAEIIQDYSPLKCAQGLIRAIREV